MKVPHKCPVCEGSGVEFRAYEKCRACDGTALVWSEEKPTHLWIPTQGGKPEPLFLEGMPLEKPANLWGGTIANLDEIKEEQKT